MRFIEYLRRNPVCFDGATNQYDFDATPLINGTTVFDVSQVAEQLIKSSTETAGNGTVTQFTPKGRELLKLRPGGDCQELAIDQYVGIIPPFANCFFEYPTTAFDHTSCDCGVHLVSMSNDWIAANCPDDGFAFVLYATVFFRFLVNGVWSVGRETTGVIASDSEGQLLALRTFACLPEGADRSLRTNYPQQTPIMVILIALMMLNCKLITSTLSPEAVKTRQQRRYEARKPSRVNPPPMRYYILAINPENTQSDGASGKGGWEMAWHKVRGFLRHLKSGKVVPVRPHSRGNPWKGVVLKDYEMRTPTRRIEAARGEEHDVPRPDNRDGAGTPRGH